MATTGVFAIATVVTMLTASAVGLAGLSQLRFASLERWGHSLAGCTVAASVVAIIAFGL